MAVILYLSNNLVQAVEAREKGKTISVQNVWQEEAPEGCLINGIITDEEAFLVWIKDFFTKNRLPKKEITLVVNSSQFNHKVLEFPKMKESELKKMIPREFAESRTENTMFTYYVLNTDSALKDQRVFVTAVEKEFLLSYINFFKQAGIEIISIDSGISALIRLFMNAPEIQGKTCMIQVMDGQDVISMLFIKGSYYYSQRNRLFTQEFPDGYARELESITDKLLQFATSQQIKEPVETLYLCGNGQSELIPLLEARQTFKGGQVIEVHQNVKKRKIEFIYPAGCLLDQKQGSSLYRQLKQEQKESRRRREVLQLLLPPAAVLIVCLLFTAYLGEVYLSHVSELSELQRKIQDTEKVEAHTSYELSTASVETMNAKITAVETIWQHLMSYPTLNSSVEEVLSACAGDEISLSIKSFQRDTGVVTLEASAANVRSINTFVSNLQENDLFKAVEYSGYTYVSGLNHYNIHVVVCLSEGAGR